MKDSSYHDFVMEEVLREVPGMTSKKMFGGWGVYKEGIIFGLILDDQLYFKVDYTNKKEFENLGSEPFVYNKKGKSIALSYWIVPEEIMNDSELIKDWINKSVLASIKSKKKKNIK